MTMKNLIAIPFFLTIFLCVQLNSSALHAENTASPTVLLQRANDAYASGNYDEAIAGYRHIVATFGLSSEVLHNLGNSYAGDGRYGLAILNYLRGLHISPGDGDLLADLQLIRKEKGLFAEKKGIRDYLVQLFDMNQWLLQALAAYSLLTLFLVLSKFLPLAKKIYPLALLLTVYISISSYGAYLQYRPWYGSVIIKPQSRLVISPFASSSPLGVIDEGTVVFSEKQHGNFHYIRDDSGRSGWIENNSLEKIETSYLRYAQDSAAQSQLPQ